MVVKVLLVQHYRRSRFTGDTFGISSDIRLFTQAPCNYVTATVRHRLATLQHCRLSRGMKQPQVLFASYPLKAHLLSFIVRNIPWQAVHPTFGYLLMMRDPSDALFQLENGSNKTQIVPVSVILLILFILCLFI